MLYFGIIYILYYTEKIKVASVLFVMLNNSSVEKQKGLTTSHLHKVLNRFALKLMIGPESAIYTLK